MSTESLFLQPTLVMMVGLPGSGKSTIAKSIQRRWPTVRIFSSDEYREKLCGDVADQTKNQLVFQTLHQDLIAALLVDKVSVILDATNICRKDRNHLLSRLANVSVKKIAYVVNEPLATCIERNRNRQRTVEQQVIINMLRRFEFPQLFEGFDQIYLHSKVNELTNTFNRDAEQKLLAQMDKFDQHNPHHMFTVGTHCAKLALQIPRTSHINKIMHEAGWWHDVGKLYTQQFDDKGIAHYYNHDNIGAYIIACTPEVLAHIDDWNDVYEVIFFINYHMRAHRDFTHDKAKNKYTKLFGEMRFNNLMYFAECDRIASGTYHI